MVTKLLTLQGHPVLAYDVTAEAVSDIVGKGAQGASGPAQVFKHPIEIFHISCVSVLFFLKISLSVTTCDSQGGSRF